MIYFFTGTGNCLYAAKRLGEALGEPLCSIPQVIDRPVSCDDEVIGIVCPVYAHRMPAMVRDFLEKARLTPRYGFIVETYGNRHGGAAEAAAATAREAGFPVAYSDVLLMADNWLPHYDAAEQAAMDKDVEGQLARIIDNLSNRTEWVKPSTEEDRAIHQAFLDSGAQFDEKTARTCFSIDERCNGCGLCADVCPGAAITMEGGFPVHLGTGCQWCFACIQLCPQKAMGFTVFDEVNRNARYRNPHVTVNDIKRANCRHCA